MRIVHGDTPLSGLKWPVATLGTFDGVHLGHQAILRQVIDWARENRGEAVLLTFSTHPRAVTTGVPAEFITSLNHRLLLMERQGIDIAVVLDFDRKLAVMPAEEFVRKYLCDLVGARGVVVGFDNRFGKDAAGDVSLLREMGRQHGFEVRETAPVVINGEPISSTAIRTAICEGRLDEAAGMLGRRVSLLGTVVSGESRGAQLGFPTANLDLHHEARPPDGLYAGYTMIRGHLHKALVSIGSQPTFHAPSAPVVVEVHVVDFRGNLYGRDMEISFIRKLRDQQQFDSAEKLIAQMHRDLEKIKAIPVE